MLLYEGVGMKSDLVCWMLLYEGGGMKSDLTSLYWAQKTSTTPGTLGK